MPDNRKQWLLISYEFGSCLRTLFDHIYRYVGSQLKIRIPIQGQDASISTSTRSKLPVAIAKEGKL